MKKIIMNEKFVICIFVADVPLCGGMEENMDIKAQIAKVVEKVSKDASFKEKFQKEPVKAIEEVLGVDLPDDVVNQVVQGVKAKMAADKLGGAVDSIKKLF